MSASVKLALVVASVWMMVMTVQVTYSQPWDRMMFGAAQDSEPADDEIRGMMKMFEPEIKKLHPEVATIEPINYRTQQVAGINYFIRARVTRVDGGEGFIHVYIWKNFNDKMELRATKDWTEVNEQSPLVAFWDCDLNRCYSHGKACC